MRNAGEHQQPSTRMTFYESLWSGISEWNAVFLLHHLLTHASTAWKTKNIVSEFTEFRRKWSPPNHKWKHTRKHCRKQSKYEAILMLNKNNAPAAQMKFFRNNFINKCRAFTAQVENLHKLSNWTVTVKDERKNYNIELTGCVLLLLLWWYLSYL